MRHAASVPWELLRDPETQVPLALEAQAFARLHPSPAKSGVEVEAGGGPIRILLVICRPAGGEDVPFRSVAGRIFKGLSEADRAIVLLEVLRPPTFEGLARALRAAKDRGKPYHVVHFDGHGAYGEGNGVRSEAANHGRHVVGRAERTATSCSRPPTRPQRIAGN